MDIGTTIANDFRGTFAIRTDQQHKAQIAKEPPSQRTTNTDTK